MTCARAHKLNFFRSNSVCPDSVMKTWLQKVLNFYNLSCFTREGRLISKVKMQNHFLIIFCGIWFALPGYYWQGLKKISYVTYWMASAFSVSNTNEYSSLCYWPLKLIPCIFFSLPERCKLLIFLATFSNRLKRRKNFCGL